MTEEATRASIVKYIDACARQLTQLVNLVKTLDINPEVNLAVDTMQNIAKSITDREDVTYGKS